MGWYILSSLMHCLNGYKFKTLGHFLIFFFFKHLVWLFYKQAYDNQLWLGYFNSSNTSVEMNLDFYNKTLNLKPDEAADQIFACIFYCYTSYPLIYVVLNTICYVYLYNFTL